MKIKQKRADFKPIVITLESQEEAKDFFSLVDKIDRCHCHSGSTLKVDLGEYRIIMDISDARSNIEVVV